MFRGARVAVVVPALNEALLVEQTLRSIPEWVDQVVMVDDASSDLTVERARAHGDPRLEIVQHHENRGVGAAIVSGYQRAFSAGADAVAVMAGDGQMDPQDLPALLGPVVEGGVDYAKGDRLSFPGARRRMPTLRWLGNHALSRMTRWATGARVRDSQCGYTVMSRDAYERLALEELWPRYGYPNDLLGRLHSARLVVGDVTVRPIYGDEQSGIGLRHALVVVPWVLARVAVRRMRTSMDALMRPRGRWARSSSR